MIDFHSRLCTSATIMKIEYSVTYCLLRLTFKGDKVYEYPEVSHNEYSKMCEAHSIGRYFAKEIQPSHTHRRVYPQYDSIKNIVKQLKTYSDKTTGAGIEMNIAFKMLERLAELEELHGKV